MTEKLAKNMRSWLFTFNVTLGIVSIPKTKVLIFNKRHTSECDNFYYGDNVIEHGEKYKHLGVVYSTKYPKNVLK